MRYSIGELSNTIWYKKGNGTFSDELNDLPASAPKIATKKTKGLSRAFPPTSDPQSKSPIDSKGILRAVPVSNERDIVRLADRPRLW